MTSRERCLVLITVVAIFTFCLMGMAERAFSFDRPAWIDQSYGVDLNGTEYTLSFTPTPFGPGWVGEVDLCWRESGSPFSDGGGCVDAGHVHQRDPGDPLSFQDLGLIGKVGRDGMSLYKPAEKVLSLELQ